MSKEIINTGLNTLLTRTLDHDWYNTQTILKKYQQLEMMLTLPIPVYL